MVAEDNKNKQSSQKQITEEQRFRFIGFEVFPGKPKDLFKSDTEKTKLVDSVKEKRAKGDVLREQCTLLEERVSVLDRAVLTVASLVIFVSIFLPWYSAYNEIAVKSSVKSEPAAVVSDSLMAGNMDTLAVAADSLATAAAATTATEGVLKTGAAEEVIHGYVAKKKIRKEYARLSGIGSFLTLGSVGSYVFSSGGVLVISAILFLIYALLCLGLPAMTLYALYGLKGDADQRALGLKKLLRYNWIPPVIFALTLFLSFFGAEYGFDSSALFVSLGSSYGPGALLGSLSWGLIISMGAFILVAAKGIEI